MDGAGPALPLTRRQDWHLRCSNCIPTAEGFRWPLAASVLLAAILRSAPRSNWRPVRSQSARNSGESKCGVGAGAAGSGRDSGARGLAGTQRTESGDGAFERIEGVGEKVVAGVDPEKLFGAPEAVVEGLELGAGAVLVVGTLNENARAATAHGVGELGVVDGRETGGDDASGAGVFQRSREGDGGAGAEAEAGQGERQRGVAAAEFGEAGAGVFHLAGTAVVGAAAEVDAAEVEA